MGLAAIRAGRQRKLFLGNLEARRDWGFAPEYVEGMWLMLQQDDPDDYVLGTGETHSVREFLAEAFAYADMNWEEYVEVDPRYFRPTDVDLLLADASKAREKLHWTPRVSFRDLVRIMVDADLEAAGLPPIGESRDVLTQYFSRWHR
jgi:GDPmannose 4,6-dehydratase